MPSTLLLFLDVMGDLFRKHLDLSITEAVTRTTGLDLGDQHLGGIVLD
jgi:hypothetical protein